PSPVRWRLCSNRVRQSIKRRYELEESMTYESKPYQPLTADNSVLVLVDHQVGLMTGVRDYEIGELKHNVVALAKAAKVLSIPTVVTTTARDSMRRPTCPELVEVGGSERIIDPTSVNAW